MKQSICSPSTSSSRWLRLHLPTSTLLHSPLRLLNPRTAPLHHHNPPRLPKHRHASLGRRHQHPIPIPETWSCTITYKGIYDRVGVRTILLRSRAANATTKASPTMDGTTCWFYERGTRKDKQRFGANISGESGAETTINKRCRSRCTASRRPLLYNCGSRTLQHSRLYRRWHWCQRCISDLRCVQGD
jgi:hypothetical protein